MVTEEENKEASKRATLWCHAEIQRGQQEWAAKKRRRDMKADANCFPRQGGQWTLGHCTRGTKEGIGI